MIVELGEATDSELGELEAGLDVEEMKARSRHGDIIVQHNTKMVIGGEGHESKRVPQRPGLSKSSGSTLLLKASS